MVARDAALAAYEGARIHVQHLSRVASVEAVARRTGGAGVRISAEVTPHHLVLTDAALLTGSTRAEDEPAPADRGRPDGAGRRACATATIDCVATDHAPHAREEKEVPFEEAPMGTIGLETAFPALHTELVRAGVLGLELLVERMTAGAALFGLPAPRIEPGAPADLVLVDLAADWTVGEAGYHSRAEHCAFDGRTVAGRSSSRSPAARSPTGVGAPEEVRA